MYPPFWYDTFILTQASYLHEKFKYVLLVVCQRAPPLRSAQKLAESRISDHKPDCVYREIEHNANRLYSAMHIEIACYIHSRCIRNNIILYRKVCRNHIC